MGNKLNEKMENTERAVFEMAKEEGMSAASAAKASNREHKHIEKAQREVTRELKSGEWRGHTNRIK